LEKGINMAEIAAAALPAVVLVHGGFVDGSGWEDTYKILKKGGYNVSIVQNPTISLADDVVATKRVLAAQNGPVVLVGHSYGGVVVTEAGKKRGFGRPGMAVSVKRNARPVCTMNQKEKRPHAEAVILGFGGGGENRTRVRKRSTVRTTCLVKSLCSHPDTVDGQTMAGPVTLL
jgi:hypothetical protein